MTFKIGSLVEVSVKKKHPSYVWRCAEVVAINRDGYTVRYFRRPGISKEGVDKVAAVEVRPCPPAAGNSMVLSVGDVAEVFDDSYWKVSMIEEVIEGACYQIRVVGSLDEFRVHKSKVRVRQEWNKNQWVLVDKDSGLCDDLIVKKRNKALKQRAGDSLNVQKGSELSSKSLKRSFAETLSTDDSFLECIQKRRALSKEVDLHANNGDLCSFTGKVNFPATLKKNSQLNNAGSRINDGAEFLARTSTPHDCVSSMTSVASCSIIDPIPVRVLSHASASCSQDLCSDAQSFYHMADEYGMSVDLSGDNISTHELDIRSYRCFLEALYAAGPLTWEQELILTNLRMKLYVSNDEHLIELRRLKCIGNALSCH